MEIKHFMPHLIRKRPVSYIHVFQKIDILSIEYLLFIIKIFKVVSADQDTLSVCAVLSN